MCRRRALCSLSFFIVLILGGIFYGKKCWISNRTEKKWKMAISFLFAWKKRDSVSKSGFATKAEATFEELLRQWILCYGMKNYCDNTLDNYRQLIKNHIVPYVGHIKINELTAVDLQLTPLCGFQNLFLIFRYSLGEYPFNL